MGSRNYLTDAESRRIDSSVDYRGAPAGRTYLPGMEHDMNSGLQRCLSQQMNGDVIAHMNPGPRDHLTTRIHLMH